jgi:hypothetical protein
MRRRQHPIYRASRTTSPRDDLFIETLFRGFARCTEAEGRLDACVSDHELELAQQQITHVKLELQQALDSYTDSRIQMWLGARSGAERLE